LLIQLNDVIRAYERQHGPLDLEPLPAPQMTSRIKKPPATGENAKEKAEFLFELIGRLNVSYRFERSFKLVDQHLFATVFC
jgi:hypothetical protein